MTATSSGQKTTVLFHRDFRRLSGGHLKVWHYFNHVRSSPGHEPWVRFSKRSVWDESNPWHRCDRIVAHDTTFDSDILFFAGVDWLTLPRKDRREARRPVINLIQHVWHADPANIRYQFLSHPAVRICVSPEAAEAIVATGRVNGPVFTIPNGIDLGEFPDPSPPSARDIDVLVVADKQPASGRRLHQALQAPGRRLHLVAQTVPRGAFLRLLQRARVTAFLPNVTEGFYLPALEGMASGTLVVCRDCVGNRSFCLPGYNSFRPPAEEGRLLEAVEAALHLPPEDAARMVQGARATALDHDLLRERAAFFDILDRLWELWAAA